MMEKSVKIRNLFLSFLKLGLTAFGGPGMASYIRDIFVHRKKWISEELFNDGIALCQSIPGATSMQVSAYVGLRLRGVFGAIASFVGFGLPAFLLMVFLTFFYTHTRNIPVAASVLKGLQVIVVSIIANATISFGKSSIKNWRYILIAILAAIFFLIKINPILVIILMSGVGILVFKKEAPSSTDQAPSKNANGIKRLLILFMPVLIGFAILRLINEKLFSLAFLMFKIDLFAFGGGFVSVPLMFHEVVHSRRWLDSSTFMHGIALGQITPGPIVITATFIGYLLFGFLGAVVSTLYVFSPSFIILVSIVPYFDRLKYSSYFQKAIQGALSCFIGLLLSTTIHFASNVHWDFQSVLLAGASFLALLLKFDILWVVIGGILLSGIIF
ncbi:MAG: chromate efflux transporter [Acidobacteriota bacterium]